jgi:hypothetical protein
LREAGFTIKRLDEPLLNDKILEKYSHFKGLLHKLDFLLIMVNKLERNYYEVYILSNVWRKAWRKKYWR